jgi:hypothetical protein
LLDNINIITQQTLFVNSFIKIFKKVFPKDENPQKHFHHLLYF